MCVGVLVGINECVRQYVIVCCFCVSLYGCVGVCMCVCLCAFLRVFVGVCVGVFVGISKCERQYVIVCCLCVSSYNYLCVFV